MITLPSLVTIVLASVTGYTFDDELALRSRILKHYDRAIVPVRNRSVGLDVQMVLQLRSIHDLDEKNQVLKTTASIEAIWENQMLTWNPDDFGGIDTLTLEPSEVWVPDLMILNSVSSNRFIAPTEAFVRMSHTGHTIWYPGTGMETRCSVRVTMYPFDTQTCQISINTWMYPKTRVRLITVQTVSVSLASFKPNGEWELVDTTSSNISSGSNEEFSSVVYTVTLKRRVAYHVINTVLPVLILSILNVLVFILPPEAGEKMSLSITVLLAYTVFLSIINEDMPDISTSVSILAVYVVLILGVSTAATFLSAIVLHYAYGEEGRNRRFFSVSCLLADKVSGERNAPTSAGDPSRAADNLPEENIAHTNGRDVIGLSLKRDRRDLVDKIDIVAFWTMTSVIVLFGFVCIMTICLGTF